MVSTWGILLGLSEHSGDSTPFYLGIDLHYPPQDRFNLVKQLAEASGVHFSFLEANDLDIDLKQPTDMLFIDSFHTYFHLTYELEKFSPKVQKYIAMHDTSEPFGYKDQEFEENRLDHHLHEQRVADYPAWIRRDKMGLWTAVVDFLERHPEWELKRRYLNCYGFTVLQRVR